ncbi:MAG: FixG Ig-like domain-containing protein [Chloroflexota bacterium]
MPNSVDVLAATDLVHEYDGYTAGKWVYTAWQYIPGSFSGHTYFILLNTYADAGPNNWSVILCYNSTTGQLIDDTVGDCSTGTAVSYVTNQWAEIRVEIDLDTNWFDLYYNGSLFTSDQWTEHVSGSGALNIAAVDLYANGANSVYYDDISLSEPQLVCDAPSDLPWLSVDPIGGQIPVGGDSDLTVTFDSTGLAVGTHSGSLCVQSDDPGMPLVVVPVELEVEPTAPNIAVAPDALTAVLDPDTTTTDTLTISNSGMQDLEWLIGEQESGAVMDAIAAAALRATIQARMPIEIDSPNFDCAAYRNYPGAEPEGYAENCLRFPGGEPLAAAGFRAPTDMGFAHDIRNTDNLVQFTLNDFPNQTVLSQNTGAIYAYDFDPTLTTLYAIDNTTQELGTMDMATGVFTAIGASVPPTDHNWTGLAIHPVDGTMYASSGGGGVSTLHTIDPATGAVTTIGDMPGLALAIDIAINAQGELYTHDISADAIYQVDPATAAVTLVGPTGFNASFAQGMDFDNNDGTLYVFLYIGSGANVYGTVDLTNGAVTPLATDNPLGEFEGATMTLPPVPCDADLPWVSVDPITGTVAGGTSTDVTVTFDATGLAGDTYTGNLCVNNNDPDTPRVTVPVTLTVNAATYDVGLSGDMAATAVPGDMVTYTVTITNLGNVADTYTVTVTSGWTMTQSATTVALDSGASTTVTVWVTVPAAAEDGDQDVATVTVTSQTDAGATASATLTTTATVTEPPMSYLYLPVIVKP